MKKHLTAWWGVCIVAFIKSNTTEWMVGRMDKETMERLISEDEFGLLEMTVDDAREWSWQARYVWEATIREQAARRCEYREAKEISDRAWHALQDTIEPEEEARELLALASKTLDGLHE